MRTLLDVLSDDRGYVRIYADHDGFGYALTSYAPSSTADLFERMSGYPSADAACAAAQFQLSSISQAKKRRRPRKASS